MENELRICSECPNVYYGNSVSEPPCKECTISEQFNVGHLKMLYIRCLPTETDIINVLIFLLIDTTNAVDDLILKIFESLNVPLICLPNGIQHLNLSSKKALYYSNVRDLYNVGFGVMITTPIGGIEKFRCCLGFSSDNDDAIITMANWKFYDLLSHSIKFWFKFWFNYTNIEGHVITRGILM
jgi:hypothetical protein